MPGDRDPALRRFELDAVIACLAMAVLALLTTAAWGLGPALQVAGGVLAGGLLIGVAYQSIKGGVDALVGRAAGPPRGRRALLVVKFFTRYALLAVAAYVMLTCFRLHPVGVVAGTSSPFVAALMQVGRLSRARARRRHS
jgi:hypothetical protein